jgi:hypothetical protein
MSSPSRASDTKELTMSEPDFRQMGDPLNDRLPPNRRPDRGFIQSTDDMSPEQIAIHNATQRIADIEGDPIMRRARSSAAVDYPLHRALEMLNGGPSALAEIDALRADVRALVIAAGRMLDGWAEGDAAVKQQLWRALHQAADDADDRHGVYPL